MQSGCKLKKKKIPDQLELQAYTTTLAKFWDTRVQAFYFQSLLNNPRTGLSSCSTAVMCTPEFKLSRQMVKDIFNPKIGYDFGGREEKCTELN